MVVMAVLINWVEMCWRATGDTGAVVKLGQCQTLQPWLSCFLSENTFFHTLTPFLSSSPNSASLSHPAFFFPVSPVFLLYPAPLMLLGNGRKENYGVQVIINER